MTRVTEQTVFASLRQDVATAQVRALKAQEIASSGMRVQRPSDDPVAFSRAAVMDAGLARLTSMKRSGQVVQQEFAASDTALADAFGLMTRAREIAMLGATDSLSADERNVLADEVDQLRMTLLSTANTQVAGTYVFGGYQTRAAPFSAAGAYVGDSGARQVEIAPGQSVTVNRPGNQIFTPVAGVDAFQLLQDLAFDLRANDGAAVATHLNTLDTASTQISDGRSALGLEASRLVGAESTRTAIEETITSARSDAVEADTVSSFSQLLESQTAMQAAIQEAARILAGLANRWGA